MCPIIPWFYPDDNPIFSKKHEVLGVKQNPSVACGASSPFREALYVHKSLP